MALIYPLGLTSTDFSAGTTTAGWQPQLFVYGAHIVIPSSGTVTQLGVNGLMATGSGGVKIGLYTSGGVLVGQSSMTVATSSLAWRDSGAVSLSVSAATYYVLASGQYDDIRLGYRTAGGNGTYATEAYATAMAATESMSIEGDTSVLYGVRVDFTASAAASPPYATHGRLMNLICQ